MAGNARRDEVLAAARDAFYEYGFARTGTRDIARRLGILGGSLYHYIDSKEALLHEVLTEVQAPARTAVERLRTATGPPADRLERLVREHVEATAADPAGIALTFTEIASLSDEHRAQVVDGLRRYRRGVAELITLGQARGELAPGADPKLVALVVLGALNWLHRWYRPDGPSPPGELAGQLASLLLDGMAADGVRPEAPRDELRAAVRSASRIRPTAFDHRARVLDAAAELFSERGFDGTTTQEIAARVGLRKASLYYYMKGKADLLLTLTAEAQEPMLAMLERAATGGADPLVALRIIIERHVCYVIEEPVRARLFLHEVRSLPPDHQAEILAREAQYTDGVAQIIGAGLARGVVGPEVVPGVAARALLGAVNWVHEWHDPRGPWSAIDIADAVADTLVMGLRVRAPGEATKHLVDNGPTVA